MHAAGVHQSGVSRHLGLLTLYSILDGLLASMVLIVVVIFQGDIAFPIDVFGRADLDEELELDDELEDEELELLEDDELLLDEELLEVGFTPPWPPQPTNSAAASSAVRGRRVAPDVGLNNVAMRFT